jgi:uncharacterized protein YegP (UPF0339 family)
MKFWNGIGTKPVTTLPPFAQITSLNIINTELNVSVGVNVIDTTTTALNVEGTFDNGVTWNTLKIVTGGIVSPITNVILPNNGDWIFRLKATNGNSSYTTGEYSDENSYQIYIPWAKINSVTNLGLNTTINFTRLDSSVTTMKAQASLDGINYTDYYVGNVIGTKAMFTLPSYNTWYFRIQATNGIVLTTPNTTDDYSEILTKVITATPPNFANIDFIEGILVGTNTNLTFTLSILDITTTLVKIEYLNSSSVWTQFIASTSLVDGMNFVKAGASYMTRKYRLKALNGTMINTYSNEIFPNT